MHSLRTTVSFRHAFLTATLVGLTFAPTSSPGADRTPAVKIVHLGDQGIQPQVVRDSQGAVHLVTFRGDPAGGDVWYARREPGANDFADFHKVNSQSGSAIAVGSIRGAQFALGKNGRPHVVWNGSGKAEPRGPGKNDSPLLYTRLNDAGTEFESQLDVIGKAYVLDGGSSVAADLEGNVHVIWHAGSSGEENRRVWLARSEDEGKTFSPERSIDFKAEGACGCCGLKAGSDQAGNVYVLFRSAREKQNRDMTLLQSRDGGKTFSTATLGPWSITTCPMSSAAFAESEKQVVIAWETQGQIEFTRIDKQTGKPAKIVRVPGTGQPRRLPAVAVDEAGDVLLTWTEGTGWQKGGDLAWQMFRANDRPVGKPARERNVPVWSFAAVWSNGSGGFEVVY